MSARLFAFGGMPLQASGGEVSLPSQVYFAGIAPWWVKLEEEICMRASGGWAPAWDQSSRPEMSSIAAGRIGRDSTPVQRKASRSFSRARSRSRLAWHGDEL